MIFNVSTGGAATVGSWRFTTATAKPSTVSKRTMIAICATAPTTITVSDAAPVNPAANDVWFHISNPEDGRAMSDGSVPIKCYGAHQYVSSAWTLLAAYYAYCGVWWELPGFPASGTALANCTWEQINRIGAAGKAADYFCVGDEKTITLTTSEVITLQIIDFAHDNLSSAGGGKAPITFGFKDCMNTTKQIGAANTGGYSAYTLYGVINSSLYNTLPSDLRAVVKDVNKLSYNGASVTTTQDKLFLFSMLEVMGAIGYGNAGEGTQYAFFTNGGSRVKNISGSPAAWWLRSMYSPSASYVCMISEGGLQTGDAPTAYRGVALGLCV